MGMAKPRRSRRRSHGHLDGYRYSRARIGAEQRLPAGGRDARVTTERHQQRRSNVHRDRSEYPVRSAVAAAVDSVDGRRLPISKLGKDRYNDL